MLPILLTIKGFYSYQKKQTINFEKLTQGGLFGIFGAVGSGKSSILEAIIFALYGDTDRLNLRENRGYNMLNLQCKEAKIEFEFQNYQQKHFRFEVSWSRNSKNHQKTTPFQRLAYQKIDEQWVPLDSNDPTEIIGLSYENFKKTIIIPQGQFKDFLELGDKDRSDMMKQIFKLQAFDLSDKVGKLYTQNEALRNEYLGKLSVFETVNQEIIQDVSNKLKTTEKQLLEDKLAFLKLQENWNLMRNLKDLQDQLNVAKQKHQKLLDTKPQLDLLEKNTELFEKTERTFGLLINEMNSAQKELQYHQEQLGIISKNILSAENEWKTFHERKITLKQKIDLQPAQKNKIESLKWLIRYQNELNSIQSQKASIQKGNEFVQLTHQKIQALLEDKNKLIIEIETLKSKSVDVNVMMAMQNWFVAQENMQNQQFKTQTQLDKLIQSITEKEVKIATLKVQFQLTSFENQLAKLESEQSELLVRKTALLVQKEVGHVAANLTHGCPCPLCGSMEHPNPMVSEDVQQKLDEIEVHHQNLELLKKEISRHNQLLDHEKEALKSLLIQKDDQEKEFEKSQIELKNHQGKFVWESFQITDLKSFEEWNQIQTQWRNQILKHQETLQNVNLKIESEKEIHEKSLAKIQVYEAKKQTSEANAQMYLEQMKGLNLETYLKFSESDIQQEIVKIETEITQNQQDWDKLTVEIDKNNNLISHLKGQKSTTEITLDAFQTKVNELFIKIEQELKNHHMASMQDVMGILNQKIDVKSNMEIVRNFKIELQTIENLMVEIQKKQNNQTFDEQTFTELSTSKIQKEQAIEQWIGQVESMKQTLLDLEQKWIEKVKLQEELNQVDARKTDLRTLSNLFQGQGFVNYISGVYLSQLCDLANARFHQLTQNKLSLILNDKNNFEVIDYLNEGHVRSVKTLSGGQSFQASLCLALALAESVQSLNQSEKNFFFIDEGFGTQDTESIHVIYETLSQLHKENRVVGVISHFEELQERITNHIRVVNDVNLGSQVLVS